MSVKVGSEVVNLDNSQVQDSTTINLRYDPNILQPLFVSRKEFEEIATSIGMGAIVQARPDPEKEAKKFHKYQRLAGMPIGKLIHKMVTSQQFLTGDGILLALPKSVQAPTETPAQAQAPADKIPTGKKA